MLQKLGADLRPGVHIEAVQICPMGRNVIQVTLNRNVDIAIFCNKEVFELKQGVRQSFEMLNILHGQDFSWIFLRKKRVIHDKTKSRQNSVNHVSWRYVKAFKR